MFTTTSTCTGDRSSVGGRCNYRPTQVCGDLQTANSSPPLYYQGPNREPPSISAALTREYDCRETHLAGTGTILRRE